MKGKELNYYRGMDGGKLQDSSGIVMMPANSRGHASFRRMYLEGETCSWTPAPSYLEGMSSFRDTCTKSEVEE